VTAGAPGGQGLWTAADVPVGTAVDAEMLESGPYVRTLLREFNAVTPENAMKWEPVHPTEHGWNFGPADRIVELAETHRLRVHGHTLVWHEQLPGWLTPALTRRRAAGALAAHIETLVGRYRGRVAAWDVVNEAVGDGGRLRGTVFLRTLGSGYVGEAFRLAHAADPGARLYYNDYGAEGRGRKSDAVYALARRLLDQGVPLHGVGLQMHLCATHPPSPDAVRTNVARLAALGLEVRISEMDVRVRRVRRNDPLAIQRRVYQDTIAACAGVPGFAGVTFWGVSDGHSWIDARFGEDDPLLLDAHYAPKPAYYGVRDALGTGRKVPAGDVPTGDPRRVFLGGAAAVVAGGVLARAGQTGALPTLLVSDPVFLEHRMEGHPERPERLAVILKALAAVPGLRRIAPRAASGEELELVHSRRHVERIRTLSESGGGAIDPDTYVTPRSFEVARTAVGALLNAVDEIAAGRARNGFCAVRPPGHHASRERAMGFCLFNQVAVAARYLQARTGWKRVLIVDFDVHHGNGTQDVFYRDDSVFYLSVHRDPFYPGTGAAAERGSGTTLNLPIRYGTPRASILGAYETAVRGAAREFRPDFVLVSAGFDAYRDDPIAGLGYEVEDYRRLMEVVVEVAPPGRVVSALEGGYNLDALGACAVAHLEPMLR
jgi:acetoin utilization deacetylase AcuC-like enzyme/GH35 family endo-1,4-beta-xylanase